MQNLWDEQEAAGYTGALAQRVYTSRLLGREPALVMHGGGNTSVKMTEQDVFGRPQTRLYVKGSGSDLIDIEANGFVPVQLDHLVALSKLASLPDPVMVNELKTHATRAGAPTPSVEAILHAILPYTYVDHTHADAVVTVTNTARGMQHVEAIYGRDVVVIPYVMPGFDLARDCARLFAEKAHAGTLGMVLMNHGIFSFGETAKQSYDRMIDLVSRAEAYLQQHGAWVLEDAVPVDSSTARGEWIALRHRLSRALAAPCIVNSRNDSASLRFCRHPDLERISQQGPATPDHIIRTKRVPMLQDTLDAYIESYKKYFETYNSTAKQPKTMLDPVPRVVLHRDRGMSCAGKTAHEARIVQDIYRHTMQIILRAETLGGYTALSQQDLFDMEYWDLEQAKLKQKGQAAPMQGEVVLITGAASGIGRACVDAFREQGAAVVALDIDASVTTQYQGPDVLPWVCDLRDEGHIQQALDEAVLQFGGIDMAVLNAGIFPGGTPLREMTLEHFRKVQSVNLDANLVLLRELHPMLKVAHRGGRVVFMGSKNVTAPGPGAAAYSASKAALNQIARIAALEWATDGIRVNTLHPDAVFDTGVWTEEVLQKRAAFYGMTVDQYKRKNLLKTPVTSRAVARLACALCGELFAKTTGAQIPVDGGNERVI